MPVSAIQLRIIADRWGEPIPPLTGAEFARLRLTGGSTDEIVVAGDHVLPGYLDGNGDQETKFRVEGRPWNRTGGAGYLDEQGRVWLVGRCAARIVDEHGTVYPLQVEAAAHSYADLTHCALIQHLGARVLMVERSTPFEDDVRLQLMSDFGWAHLAAIVTVARIPMDRRHNAKVDYMPSAKWSSVFGSKSASALSRGVAPTILNPRPKRRRGDEVSYEQGCLPALPLDFMRDLPTAHRDACGGWSVEMSEITNSWAVPAAALPTSFPSANSYPSLRNRGWFIAWVCSAVACMAAAALTRYPQPASLTAGVSFEIGQQPSAADGPHEAGPTLPLADGKN